MRSLLLSVAVTVILAACTASEPSRPVAPSSPAPTGAASSSVAVPNVLGLDAIKAVHAKERARLTAELSVMTGVYTDGAIVEQRLSAGSLVRVGRTVHIVVGPAA